LEKALSGIKVFDASQGIAGPHATFLLALHGADVMKIEPLEGDWGRVLGRKVGEETIHYLAFNSGKRSIALDLKSKGGREAALKLAAQADIFIESYRPGVIGRLGLGYEEVRRINPDIIYASVSGYGQKGPNTAAPATDALIQAYSGMMKMNHTDDGRPHRNGMIVIDGLTGLYAYQAISTALIKRLRFGGGAYLDISLAQAAAAFQAAKIMEFVDTGGRTTPLYVPAGMYETADDYVVINGMRPNHFAAVCKAVDCEALAQDPRWPTPNDRLKYTKEINEKLREAFKRFATTDVVARLRDADVMVEGVKTYGDWLEDPHATESEFYHWVETKGFGRMPIATVPGAPECPSGIAPHIGEHTREILADAGFDADWIDTQIKSGAFAESQHDSQPVPVA